MKYYYTDQNGFTVEIVQTESSNGSTFFEDKESTVNVDPSEFVDQLVYEISMSGEELPYCVQCTNEFFDRKYSSWTIDEEFSEEDILRFMNYVNSVIEEVQEESDEDDPFFHMKKLNTATALSYLNGAFYG